jgi:hypothetical protein
MDIASIERGAQEVISLGTVEVSNQGGEAAAAQFLRNNLCTLIAAAYRELGPANACQLAFEGLMTAEAMAAGTARS